MLYIYICYNTTWPNDIYPRKCKAGITFKSNPTVFHHTNRKKEKIIIKGEKMLKICKSIYDFLKKNLAGK